MPLSAESASGPKKPIANFKFAMEGLEARRLFTAGDSTTIVKLEVYEQTSEAVPTTPNDYLASIVVNEDASGTAITSASLKTRRSARIMRAVIPHRQAQQLWRNWIPAFPAARIRST